MAMIFTYGSLMCADIMTRVAGEPLLACAATLKGYRRYLVHGQEYPSIVKEDGASVEGLIYKDVSVEALRRLDAFEGSWYRRFPVEVSTDQGLRAAEAYVIRPRYRSLLSDKDWDYEIFLQRGKAKFMKEYVGYITI